jgi:hypothetical protein
MADEKDSLGSSGVFKAIVASARKFKRAVTGADEELSPVANEVASMVARAFVAGKFEDVHALGTHGFKQRTDRARFVTTWSDAARARGPFTSFEIASVGSIDLGFIPGLEDVPQSQFQAFIEIRFSTPQVSSEEDKAFAVAVVLLDEDGETRIGALHAR